MDEIAPVSCSSPALLGLRFCLMDTNAALRKRAFRLVNRLGISQKVLASKMGMPTSTFSKWLNRKGVGPVPVTALDGLNAYLGELREELDLG